jgi:hypothetical protein
MIIDDLEYPILEKNFKFIQNSGKFAYKNNNENNWNDKNELRIYNHFTKEHFLLIRKWDLAPGDNNLIFVDFPRTDGPTNSWTTQHALVKCHNDSKPGLLGDFMRFTILSIDRNGYCDVTDGYNTGMGAFARDCFYSINKILKT